MTKKIHSIPFSSFYISFSVSVNSVCLNSTSPFLSLYLSSLDLCHMSYLLSFFFRTICNFSASRQSLEKPYWTTTKAFCKKKYFLFCKKTFVCQYLFFQERYCHNDKYIYFTPGLRIRIHPRRTENWIRIRPSDLLEKKLDPDHTIEKKKDPDPS